MQTSEQINEISAALAKAQGDIENASKDGTNPAFEKSASKGKYATLASVWEACRSALSKNGIAVVQSPGTDDQGAVTMTTTLCHSSGQWMRSEMACKPSAGTAQQLGSVITYLRRYALASMAGVAPDDDDDGNQASGTVTPSRSPQSNRQQSKPSETPFDGDPAPRQQEPAKRSPEDFWKKSNLCLDPGNKLTLEEFAGKFTRSLESAPSEKCVNKLVADNDTRVNACGLEGLDLSENISLALGRLMAA